MLTGSYGYEDVKKQSGYEPMPTLLTPITGVRIVVIPGLAEEIGGPEQQIFGQVLWLIQWRGQFVDGRYWAEASAIELHDEWTTHFGEEYIHSILRRLEEELRLLDSRKDLNQTPFDQTKWYSLNIEEASKLKSVVVGWEPSKTPKAEPAKTSNRTPVEMEAGNPNFHIGNPKLEVDPSTDGTVPQHSSELDSGTDGTVPQHSS